MRIPILLAIVVIVLTPANIREVTSDMFAQAQATVSNWLGGAERTKVAAVESALAPSGRQN